MSYGKLILKQGYTSEFSVIKKALKSWQPFSGSWQKGNPERFKAEGLSVQWLDWRRRGWWERECGWPPAAESGPSLIVRKDLSSRAAEKNWILPIIWMSWELISFPEPPDRRPAWPTPWFLPWNWVETTDEPTWAFDLYNCEIKNGYCLNQQVCYNLLFNNKKINKTP